MFYRKVYPQAWQIVKRNPTIWFFGLFASLLGFYEVRALFNFSDKFPDFISSNIKSWVDIFITFSTINMTWADVPDVLALLGLFILFSAVTILAVSSQGALTYAATFKNKYIKESILEQLKRGVEKFWPIFGLNILNSLIGYFFVAFVLTPLISFISYTSYWQIYIILGLFAFFILIPLIIIISFVTRYGIAYIMIKDQKFTDAFVNSWLLFKVNWIITIENAMLLVFITFMSIIAIVSSMVLIFIPFIIIVKLLPVLGFMFAVISFFLMAAIFITGTAVYSAFYNVVWGSIFLDLAAPGKSHSKLYRLASQHLPRLAK